MIKRNENHQNPPELTDNTVLVRRNKPRKVDSLFEKIKVTDQIQNKIMGVTSKGHKTSSNINKIEPLRKQPC